MKKANYTDEICAQGSTFSKVESHNGGLWFSGTVWTPDGIVETYSQGGERVRLHTRLTFVYKGRRFVRYFSKKYKPRALVTQAKKFAREMVKQS